MIKNMKIGKKLIISFIVVSLIASIAGIISIFMMQSIDTEYSEALVDYGFSQGDIGKALVTLSNGNRYTRDIIGFADAEDISEATAYLADADTKYKAYTETVTKTLVNDAETAQFNVIDTAMAAYLAKRTEVIKMGNTTDSNRSITAQLMAVNELDPLYDAVYDAWAKLLDMNITTGTTLSADLTKQSQFSMGLNMAFAVVALIISVIFGTLISRGISVPITKCVERLHKLAQGNLKDPVPEINAKDETGMLADATKTIVESLTSIIQDEDYLLGEMARGNFDITSRATESYIGDFFAILSSIRNINGSLSSTLSQINQSADQVSYGSEQVSSGAQALSQGATEQASSVEELAATINEISSQVNSNALNAQDASKRATESGEYMIKSNHQMTEMIAAMSEISKSSSEIGKIIKTIEDIAFQTNILALNAAVEAARAGAAGKGFAVVADEVRNLASKSAEASKSTSSLIEDSLAAVEHGTRIADETARALMIAVEGSKVVTEIIDKISDASSEQASSIAQVTQGVDQISSVVQTNSATAEESAAASEELSGQAQILKDLVSRFTLKDSDTVATGVTQPKQQNTEKMELAMAGGKY